MSNSKEFILQRLRDSKAHNPNIPNFEPHYKGAMKLTHELLEEFITNHTNNKSIIVHSNTENILHDVKEILKNEGAKKVLYNPDIIIANAFDTKSLNDENLSNVELIPYTYSVDEHRGELFSIDTSIVQARCGVANIGVIGLSANPNAPRLSSLITNTCIYLLEKQHIVEHMFEGIELMKTYEKQLRGNDVLPSNLIFVAGPSRTADIELQTVFGVHGPRKTFVVLY
ncbi:lactate utilization protein C [Helicobacter didelphidarum]|uniref:Lactate utilization protein C n=1 Tax=Helicobacter didelphidarum TaxID=2040648 RepID=A0A3D8IJV5_9HELI|nr:LUD domain-containing protein [Helicobacter didelphidarum]RDU65403.1 lactate utilization protein C [Helicobacter didelphidarum]